MPARRQAARRALAAEALESCRRAAEADPADAKAHIAAGAVHESQGHAICMRGGRRRALRPGRLNAIGGRPWRRRGRRGCRRIRPGACSGRRGSGRRRGREHADAASVQGAAVDDLRAAAGDVHRTKRKETASESAMRQAVDPRAGPMHAHGIAGRTARPPALKKRRKRGPACLAGRRRGGGAVRTGRRTTGRWPSTRMPQSR